jgi:hypothetical protein
LANIGTLGDSLTRLHIFTEAHAQVISRHSQGFFAISGCDVHQAASPGMTITVDSGTVGYNGQQISVSGLTVSIDTADMSNPRFDVITINDSGIPQVSTGVVATIMPLNTTDPWQMTVPFVASPIPSGVILAIVYVEAGTTSILNAAIDDIALYGTALSSGGTWTTLPGTPTRVSDTQFTIADTSNANKYDKLFARGRVLKWMESTTLNIAIVTDSSYATNVVTVNIIGDSLTAGFTDIKYANILASKILVGMIPGNVTVAINPTGAKYFTYTPILKFMVDAYVGTAGVTGNTDIDVNVGGTSILSTKASIAGGGTSDLNNICDSPITAIVANSVITVDIDTANSTPAKDAYVYLWCFPEALLYQ